MDHNEYMKTLKEHILRNKKQLDEADMHAYYKKEFGLKKLKSVPGKGGKAPSEPVDKMEKYGRALVTHKDNKGRNWTSMIPASQYNYAKTKSDLQRAVLKFIEDDKKRDGTDHEVHYSGDPVFKKHLRNIDT
jgi:FKBP-type peptidyl-prolyl cis-trans isomerase